MVVVPVEERNSKRLRQYWSSTGEGDSSNGSSSEAEEIDKTGTG